MDINTAYDNSIANRDAAAFEHLRAAQSPQPSLADLKTAYVAARTREAEAAGLLAIGQEAFQRKIDRLKAEFEELYAADIEEDASAKAAFKAANENLRSFVIAAYESTGEKTIDSDCSVRINTALNILDKSEAIRWAKENAPILLTINEADFRKFPKIDEQPFIEKVETATAVIKKFEA